MGTGSIQLLVKKLALYMPREPRYWPVPYYVLGTQKGTDEICSNLVQTWHVSSIWQKHYDSDINGQHWS